MVSSDKFFNNFKTYTVIINSSKVYEDDYRLTAEYFTNQSSITLNKDIQFSQLKDFAKVIGFGPFKRHYIYNQAYGVPLISSSEMMEANPSCEGYISKKLQKNYEQYLVEKDWILVSCSGTIGNVTIVDDRINGFAVSQHALRVIPKEKKHRGYLYTYLSSEFGQAEVKGKKSGAVIDEIYNNDLLRLPIPVIDEEIILKVNHHIENAISLREQANELLKESNKLVYEYNNLPPLKIEEANFYDDEKIIQSRILKSTFIKGDFRLDAHYYNPISELAEQNILKFSKNYILLGQISHPTYMGSRSSRNYVAREFGIPFLSGRNIIQIRPTDLKYISKQETFNLDELLLNKGWILITRSGTLARTILIWDNYEGYAASEHLIRIIPNADGIDSGYLYAFLSSDYGYHQLIKCKHGSVIDEITEDQIGATIIPLAEDKQQKIIGDRVRLAYEKRAEAIRIEDAAQVILKQSLTS